MQHLNIKAITAYLFLSSACYGKGLLIIGGGYFIFISVDERRGMI